MEEMENQYSMVLIGHSNGRWEDKQAKSKREERHRTECFVVTWLPSPQMTVLKWSVEVIFERNKVEPTSPTPGPGSRILMQLSDTE